MTYIAYEPEPPLFESTILAFQRFSAPAVGCTIDAHPRGPVNRIVSLVVGEDLRRVKSALVSRHELDGALVKVERVNTPTTTTWDTEWQPIQKWQGRTGYRVTVEGREVLYASDAEIWPPPKQVPESGLKAAQKRTQAVRRAIRKRARAVGDRIAHRFGYVHEAEAGGW